MTVSLHHLSLATRDFEKSIEWFVAFLKGKETWRTESFSELTQSRVPGIRRMVEIRSGSIRVHLFSSDDDTARRRLPGEHYALLVTTMDELHALRERWIALAASYGLSSPGLPSSIAVDSGGVASFYARDITGAEFEVTHEPRPEASERSATDGGP